MPARVFISYRRDDTLEVALRLQRELMQRLAGIEVYLDVAANRGGENYINRIHDEIAQSRVFICLIGSRWLAAGPGDGDHATSVPRLFEDNDVVRKELEAAILLSKDIVPVRVGNGEMPKATMLPDTLFTLPTKHAPPLREDAHFDRDVAAIARDVKRLLKGQSIWRMWRERAAIAAVGLLAVSFVANVGFVAAHAFFPDSWLARQASEMGGRPSYAMLLESHGRADNALEQRRGMDEQHAVQLRLKDFEIRQLTLERERAKEEVDHLRKRLSPSDEKGRPYDAEAAWTILQELKSQIDSERQRSVRLEIELSQLKNPPVAGGARSNGMDAGPASGGSGSPAASGREAPQPGKNRPWWCAVWRSDRISGACH